MDRTQKRLTLFLSVSLPVAFSEGISDARSYVDAFLASTGWKPTQSLLVAGALHYAEYDYFKEQIIEYLVLKGRKVEGPKGDHEFTDWGPTHLFEGGPIDYRKLRRIIANATVLPRACRNRWILQFVGATDILRR